MEDDLETLGDRKYRYLFQIEQLVRELEEKGVDISSLSVPKYNDSLMHIESGYLQLRRIMDDVRAKLIIADAMNTLTTLATLDE